MTTLRLITSNPGKVREFEGELGRLGISIQHSRVGYPEIQGDDLDEVVEFALDHLQGEMSDLIIDDSGLFIDALEGFPGVYSAFVLRTLGCEGILRLMEGREYREAAFRCCIGCQLGDGGRLVITEETRGSIANEERGEEGFGFDPIFVPSGHDITFAEMDLEEKNRISHRGRAVRAFAKALEERHGTG
ncbi:MAG: XTP/dITP diphosphatase [Methanomassiliicoccales archaeon]